MFTRGRLRFYVAKRRTTALTPVRSKITYHKYVGFCFGRALPCSSSVWRHKTFVFKPCQRPSCTNSRTHEYVRVAVRGAFSRSSSNCSNGVAVEATNESLLLNTALVRAISTAQPLFTLKKRWTKNSNRNSVRVLAWCVRASTQAGKRTLIQCILISGMCLFRVRAARRREYECRA